MNRVTITGADDRTPISALIDISAEFPFVEWGILVSMRQEGGYRFPSRDWQGRFASAICDKADVAMHVCGEWVRRLLRGQLDWNDLPLETRIVADRVQINTHAEEHVSCVSMFDWMAEHSKKQFIVQLDGVNDHIFDAAVHRKLNVAGLFDCSHGAGVLPDAWPRPTHDRSYHGFAGGLGPTNAAAQAKKIADEIMGIVPFWIDMEGRVRTDENLDLVKVRQVLESCSLLVKTTLPN